MPTLLAQADKLASQVHNVAFSPDGSVLAAACNDTTVRLYTLPDLTPAGVLEGHTRGAIGLAFFPDGRTLAVSDYDSIRLWNVDSRRQTAHIPAHTSWVYAVAVPPDGGALLSVGNDFYLRLWDAATHALRFEWKGPRDAAEGVAISPDGHTWAVAMGSSIGVWDFETQTELFRLNGHRQRVKCLAFSPDGATLASASYDRTVRLWDPALREEKQTMQGHKNRAWCVAWRLDGGLLASVGWDGAVCLWDPTNGEARVRLAFPSPNLYLQGVAFSPDGRFLAACGGTATVGDIALWDVADLT